MAERNWFHRLGNIRAKLPDETAGEVLAHVYAVRDAPTLDGRPFGSGGDHLPESWVMVPRRQERISASAVVSVCSA
jgi:hypothetical protein